MKNERIDTHLKPITQLDILRAQVRDTLAPWDWYKIRVWSGALLFCFGVYALGFAVWRLWK